MKMFLPFLIGSGSSVARKYYFSNLCCYPFREIGIQQCRELLNKGFRIYYVATNYNIKLITDKEEIIVWT